MFPNFLLKSNIISILATLKWPRNDVSADECLLETYSEGSGYLLHTLSALTAPMSKAFG